MRPNSVPESSVTMNGKLPLLVAVFVFGAGALVVLAYPPSPLARYIQPDGSLRLDSAGIKLYQALDHPQPKDVVVWRQVRNPYGARRFGASMVPNPAYSSGRVSLGPNPDRLPAMPDVIDPILGGQRWLADRVLDFFVMNAEATGCSGTGSCYWINGTGNWSNTSHWATSSGGSMTGGLPTSSDAVYFDGNSGAGTVTVDVNASMASFTDRGTTLTTLAIGTYNFADSGAFTVAVISVTVGASSGTGLTCTDFTVTDPAALTLGASAMSVGGNWDSNLGTFVAGTSFVGLSGSDKTVEINGTAGFYDLAVHGYQSSYTMASAIDVSHTLSIDGSNFGGSLTTAGHNITGGASFGASYGGELIASSSALTFGPLGGVGGVELVYGATLTLTTGSITDSGDWIEGPHGGTFTCGTSTVTLSGSNASIYIYSDPFYNLTVSGSVVHQNALTVLNHLTVTGTLSMYGGVGTTITFNSLTATNGSIVDWGTSVTARHFSVTDSNSAALVTIASLDTWTNNDYGFTYTDSKTTDTITFTISSLTAGKNFNVTKGRTFFYSGTVTSGGLVVWTMTGADASAVGVTVGGLPPSPPEQLPATPGNAQIMLDWRAPVTEGGSPITNYKIYRGTASGVEVYLTTVGNVVTYTDTGLTNGVTYYYQVSAKNAVGEGPKSNEASVKPTPPPDTVPPSVAIVSPVDGATLTSTSVTVTGSASDNVAVAKVELSLNGTMWVAATGTTSWSSTLTLAAGANTIGARATDTSGYVATATITVTVTALALSTTATASPTSGTALLTVSFTASASGGTSPYAYSWNFGDQSATSAQQNPTHAYPSAGTFTATLTVMDSAGKTAQATATITVTSASGGGGGVSPTGGAGLPGWAWIAVIVVIGAVALVAVIMLRSRRKPVVEDTISVSPPRRFT